MLSSSLEDYIEAIYTIIEANEAVRAKDISQRLGVKNSSVTGALRILAEKQLINYTPYGIITLTEKGKSIARNVTNRHETLTRFFTDVLGIQTEAAEDAACKMEHAMTEGIRKRLDEFLEFSKKCPRMSIIRDNEKDNYCSLRISKEICLECFEKDNTHAYASTSKTS
ncbi:MAG: metal-dependent transcriptional regulator [Spirochaetales bacterium]|nr:metal-dependent transcriptional regulator [Spirochaetales bacterium]